MNDNPTKTEILKTLWSLGMVDVAEILESHARIVNLGGCKIEISGKSDAFMGLVRSGDTLTNVLEMVSEGLGWGEGYEWVVTGNPNPNYDKIQSLVAASISVCENIIKGDAWLGANWDKSTGSARIPYADYEAGAERFRVRVRELDRIIHRIEELGGKFNYNAIYNSTEARMVKTGALSREQYGGMLSNDPAKAVEIIFGGRTVS